MKINGVELSEWKSVSNSKNWTREGKRAPKSEKIFGLIPKITLEHWGDWRKPPSWRVLFWDELKIFEGFEISKEKSAKEAKQIVDEFLMRMEKLASFR